ncbi:MAG: ADP-ribosylglycohydrolase family protein [Candidatus Omnitrophica bacterium]|nr:ADP-ribosylglycohydrolase family protein [Candidatus Omnitrophota bacterium]
MPYPNVQKLRDLVQEIELVGQLQHERGSHNLQAILRESERELQKTLSELNKVPVDQRMAEKEPNDLDSIRALRPKGPRRIWKEFDKEVYRNKLEGGLLGRFAGCTLGAPVELWPVEKMKALAEEFGQEFPPTRYWKYVPEPKSLRYDFSPVEAYTRGGMDGVPVDDDIVYTILGLLIVEEYGLAFTTEEVGKAWLKYLPHACTAEEVALNHLKAGVPAEKAGEKENPYREWIGADIRSDPWGYLAPGWPERAADMAYRDAYLSHRRQGIYGSMFFAATIAAAFTVEHPIEAVEIGLTEIPKDCASAKAIRWAFKVAPEIKDYRDARAAVDQKFSGMDPVHTINNACLTVFGLSIGGTDLTRVISETVAMGLDNDCTAATAGSIVGVIIGQDAIPERWTKRFNNRVHSYLIDHPKFSISGLLKRFTKQARGVYESELR